MENLALESTFASLKAPNTKFEAVPLTDVEREKFQAIANALRQISKFGFSCFRLVATSELMLWEPSAETFSTITFTAS